jgi:hypothetical protein
MAEFQKRVLLLTRSDSAAEREEAQRLTREMPEELVQEAEKAYRKLQSRGALRYQHIGTIFGARGRPPESSLSEEEYTFRYFCWFRYNRLPEELMAEYNLGSFKAAKQLHGLRLEFDKWRFGKLDPNKLKFKTDVDHFDLIAFGLDWGV